MVFVECPQDKIIVDLQRGETICIETGEVLEDRMIDLGQDWRAFDAQEKIERSRAEKIKTTVHDLGLSTDIELKAKDRRKARKLRLSQLRARTVSSNERNLARALTLLEKIAGQLGLPQPVREEAARIYRKALEKNLIRGRSIEEVLAASIYVAARKVAMPITLEDLTRCVPRTKKVIGKAYRLLLREGITSVPANDPKHYVSKLTSALGLSVKTLTKALELIEKAKQLGITSGKDPVTIAAATVYIAAVLNGEKRTKQKVADAAGITTVTVRANCKILAQKFGITLPDGKKTSSQP